MSLQTAIMVAVASVLATSALGKTASTFYPPERVANARRNIERYEWARQIRDSAVAQARIYADLSDDVLWELVTPQSIPRGTQVSIPHGCPKCGKAIERFGGQPWKCDPIKRPWKIECPSCGEVFPKNDFGRFYESGKDERGVFRFERADRSLLFNTDHPDPSDPLHTYGVDDTHGWKDDRGRVFRFIGYYGHYGTWNAVKVALARFREAYNYTGDPLYARKAGVILYRAAEFYPEMDWAPWHKLGFNNSDGGSGMGKVYGRIWEMTVANTLMSAYDAVYSGLDDPALLGYLSRKAGKPVTAADIRRLIERNIIHEAHDAILQRRIAGNEGMHQSTMTMAAVVLDEPGTSEEWLRWVFAPGDLLRGDPAGGNIARLFETKIDDDGMGNEASPTYNSLWRRTFRLMSEMLEHYPAHKGPRFTDFAKYRKMFETPVRLICLDRYIPFIGDTGKTGNPGTDGISIEDMVYAYRTFKDPIFARMAYYLNGNKAAGIRGDIFDPDPEDLDKQIEAEVRKHGPYVPQTEEMPHYGLVLLRGGSGEHQRALSLYHGINTGHGHKDTLNIELFGLGLDLMPEIGYPEHATIWPARSQWTSNTISHNTVVVDRTKQRDNRLGKARFVKQGDGASAAEVYATEPYPQTSLYQRTVAMVDVSEKDFYVVDIFRVKGGKEHHYSLHGPEGKVETQGLNLVAQAKGTLAGEDVPFAADLGGRETNWKDASGFQYLYDIRRDTKPSKCPIVTWKVKDTWGVLSKPTDVRLGMHLVNPPGEVILAHGDPPQNKEGNPRRLTYVLMPNAASESTFVSVIEPYVGSSAIDRIDRKDDGGEVTLEITLKSGRVDTIVSSIEPGRLPIPGRGASGRFAVFTQQEGRTEVRLVAE